MAGKKLRKHDHNKQLGKAGEELATEYLQGRDYEIIERNWRTRYGEIDIVASKNQTLYLIEVKTRSSAAFGYPSEAITKQKLQRMYLTATIYISNHNYRGKSQLLVLEVLNGQCSLLQIE